MEGRATVIFFVYFFLRGAEKALKVANMMSDLLHLDHHSLIVTRVVLICVI